MSYEDYTWLNYYEDLYHRQKKHNNALAVQLGETEAKSKELQISLNRVIGSPFWKALAPARKVYSLIKGDKGGARVVSNTNVSQSVSTADKEISDALLGYQNRLELLEDYYGQWIRKDRMEIEYSSVAEESTGMAAVCDALFKYVSIEDCVGCNNPLEGLGKVKWLVFIGKNGCPANGFAKRAFEVLKSNADALIAYADEDYYFEEKQSDGSVLKRRVMPNFKPDWSPDTLDSFFYLGNISMIENSLAAKLHWLGSDNAFANVYDLFLQASEHVGKHYDTKEVVHISQILFHNSAEHYLDGLKTTNSTCYETWKHVCDSINIDLAADKLIWGYDEAYNEVKRAAFERRGLAADFLEGQFPGTLQIAYKVPEDTLISVLLLTKDHPEVLKTCMNSFIEKTDYSNVEFIIVDNGSNEEHKAEYEAYFDEISQKYACKYIHKPMEFNFSAMCNIAAGNAKGSLFLFMNDDIEIIQKDWLKIMAGYAKLPHIGAVGAKLLYANTDKIQHAGVTSLEIGPSHKLVIFPDDKSYYFGKNVFNHDMLGVTAACLLIDADKYREVGGFNEEFAVAYNDVDFCMKIAKAGYDNLQCNAALLYHYESMTRGLDAEDSDKWNRLLGEKEKLYLIHPEFYKHDPYYSCNLIGNHSLYLSNYDFGYNNHLKNAIVEQLDASKLAECKGDGYKISIDFAGLQEKENRGEADAICIRGWSFGIGKDNCSHAVRVVLKNETTGVVMGVETDLCPRDDLENVFPDEKNIRLCGFVARILSEDLPEGSYAVGVEPVTLKHDLTDYETSGKVVFTDIKITI